MHMVRRYTQIILHVPLIFSFTPKFSFPPHFRSLTFFPSNYFKCRAHFPLIHRIKVLSDSPNLPTTSFATSPHISLLPQIQSPLGGELDPSPASSIASILRSGKVCKLPPSTPKPNPKVAGNYSTPSRTPHAPSKICTCMYVFTCCSSKKK